MATPAPDLSSYGEPTAASVEEASLALVELTLKALSASTQLSVLQVRVLLAVDRYGPVNLSDVAGLLDVSRPSASRIVARLVDDGLLLRRTPLGDRRQLHLMLSARGRRTLARLRTARQSGIQDVLAAMSDPDRAALAAGFAAFAQASRRTIPAGDSRTA